MLGLIHRGLGGQKRAVFSYAGNNIWVNTNAARCASTAVHISPDSSRRGSVFIGATCPAGLAFMGLTGELRPGNFSTSALEQPARGLV